MRRQVRAIRVPQDPVVVVVVYINPRKALGALPGSLPGGPTGHSRQSCSVRQARLPRPSPRHDGPTRTAAGPFARRCR